MFTAARRVAVDAQQPPNPAHAVSGAHARHAPLSVQPVRRADASASGVSLSTMLSTTSKSTGALDAAMTFIALVTSSGPMLRAQS